MTEIAITSVELMTARGGVRDLGGDAAPVAMPWYPARRYRPLIGSTEVGPRRLVDALAPAYRAHRAQQPLVVASCNGSAASWELDLWQGSFGWGIGPVVSSACASGMHALYLARQQIAAGAPEVWVVAADIVTPPGHANFEALRVLADVPAPFQPEASGFLLGEAGVALRLEPAAHAPDAPRLIGPVLAHDLDGDDGIARALTGLAAAAPLAPALVIGQGAGPIEADRAELAAIAAHVAPEVPLTTALPGFGHTLGASSLLSVALAVLARDAALPALASPHPMALDGRPLGAPRSRRTLVVCRALIGACGACLVGDAAPAPRPQPPPRLGDRALCGPARPLLWRPPSQLLPLRDPVLRAIAASATAHRPDVPPDLVIVTLEAPLPPSVAFGKRILPTSVLEMTPGQLPQLIARAWGYPGPALCLVGGDPAPVLAACRATHDRVYRVAIHGMDRRNVEWDA